MAVAVVIVTKGSLILRRYIKKIKNYIPTKYRGLPKVMKIFIMTTQVINGKIDKSQYKPGPKNDPITWCPGTLSYDTLTKLLRAQPGFKGVIANEYSLDIALEKSY